MDSEAIEEAAARWFAKQQSGAWTDADQADFDAWIDAATAHRIQYLRVQTAWKNAACLTALGAGVPSGVIPGRHSWGDARFSRSASLQASSAAVGDGDECSRDQAGDDTESLPHATGLGPGSRRAHVRGRFLAAAAALLMLIAGTYVYDAGFFAGDRYSTPVGGLHTVALTDGSRVTLNTDSRIRVDLQERERRIALSKGEAFFDVAKDAARPFVVEVGNKRVTAVGTKFSVRRNGEDIQVVVTEGKVRVATVVNAAAGEGPSSRETGATTPAPHEILLAAGSVARTVEDEVLVRPDTLPEVEKLLSWRNGYVTFEDMMLTDAVAEFNRYNTRKIVIEDAAISRLRFSGNFRANNTDAFLWLLQSGFPVTVEQRKDEVVLRAR